MGSSSDNGQRISPVDESPGRWSCVHVSVTRPCLNSRRRFLPRWSGAAVVQPSTSHVITIIAGVSDDEVTLGMSVPLDSDGFLRRECPTCEREFKWLPSGEDDSEDASPLPDGGYFCPYCGIQAPAGHWLTKAQAELAQNIVATEVLGPMLKDFNRDLRNIGRRSGGLISVSAEYDGPDPMEPLTEADDMKRVDSECHPSEPLKVLEEWAGPVHCLVCGAPVQSAL